MSREDLYKFKKLIVSDSTIQERLGSVTSEAEFFDVVVSLAEEKDLVFTKEELEKEIDIGKASNMTLGSRVISQLREEVIQNQVAIWYNRPPDDVS